MALLSVFLPDSVMRARLGSAVRTGAASHALHDLLYATDWPEMHQLSLRSAPLVSVFDPYSEGGLDACSQFGERFPSIVLVPYADFRHHPPQDVLRLSGMGVRRIVCLGDTDTPACFRTLLAEALVESSTGRIADALRDIVPPGLDPVIRALLSRAALPLPPRELAHALFCHEKTLREWLRQAGLPSTNRLIVWARLFHAVCLLEDPARSVENTALALGFPSLSAFHKQMTRYAGQTPRKAMAAGGLNFLVACFRARYGARDE